MDLDYLSYEFWITGRGRTRLKEPICSDIKVSSYTNVPSDAMSFLSFGDKQSLTWYNVWQDPPEG